VSGNNISKAIDAKVKNVLRVRTASKAFILIELFLDIFYAIFGVIYKAIKELR
jgi:hypothetical protein